MRYVLILDPDLPRLAGLAHVLAERGCAPVLALDGAQAGAVLARRMVDGLVLPQEAVAGLGALSVPVVCLSACDEAGAAAVFALSPMIYAVMAPETPAAVVADLLLSAMRETPVARMAAPLGLPEVQAVRVADTPAVPLPAAEAGGTRKRLTLA